METFIKKGIKIRTQKNGIKKYEPFAVYYDGKKDITYHIKALYGGVDSIIYILTLDNYGISKTSENEAIDLLNNCVNYHNREIQDDEDKKIIKEEIKYI